MSEFDTDYGGPSDLIIATIIVVHVLAIMKLAEWYCSLRNWVSDTR